MQGAAFLATMIARFLHLVQVSKLKRVLANRPRRPRVVMSVKRLRAARHVLGACATLGFSFARMLHMCICIHRGRHFRTHAAYAFIAEGLPTNTWSVMRAPHDDPAISRGFDSRTKRKRKRREELGDWAANVGLTARPSRVHSGNPVPSRSASFDLGSTPPVQTFNVEYTKLWVC